MVCPASCSGPIRPIRNAAPLNSPASARIVAETGAPLRTSSPKRCHSGRHQLPKHVVAAQPPVAADGDDIGRDDEQRGQHARQRRAEHAERGRAEVAEYESVVAEHGDADRQHGDRRGEDRAAERGDEVAQHVGHQHRHDRPLDHTEERPRARSNGGRLARRQHDFLAEMQESGRRQPGEQRQPQTHPGRAAHFAHGVPPTAQLGRDQRRDHARHARERPRDEAEQRYREARGRQRLGAQPGDEDHVDRVDQHLREIGDHQRPGERQRRDNLAAPAFAAMRGFQDRVCRHQQSRPG